MKTIRVHKMNPGDITMCMPFGKIRPMLVLEVRDNFVYGLPITTKKQDDDDLIYVDVALNNCRFLDKGRKQYLIPSMCKVSKPWAMDRWMGCINPASLNKIKKTMFDIMKTKIFKIND